MNAQITAADVTTFIALELAKEPRLTALSACVHSRGDGSFFVRWAAHTLSDCRIEDFMEQAISKVVAADNPGCRAAKVRALREEIAKLEAIDGRDAR